MKKVLLALLLSCLAIISVRADLIWYEPFNYPNGCIETNSGGLWICHSPAMPLKDALVNNHKLEIGSTGSINSRADDIHRLLCTNACSYTNSTTVLYASLTVNFPALPSSNGAYFAHFYINSSTFNGKLWVLTGNPGGSNIFVGLPGTYRLGVSGGGLGHPSAIYPVDLATNTDYQVVMELDQGNIVTYLWLNPLSSADWYVSSNDILTPGDITAFAFRQASGLAPAAAVNPICTISNLAVATTFDEAATNVWPATPVAPIIVYQPKNTANYVGTTMSLSAVANGQSLGALTYQWQMNGTAIPGATSNVYTVARAASTDTGQYTLIVSNPTSGLSATSAPVWLVALQTQSPGEFFQSTVLPPTNSMYVTTQLWSGTFPNHGIIISNLAHRLFSLGVLPPPSGDLTHSFTSQAEMDVSMDGGLTWQSCVATNVSVQVHITNNGQDGDATVYGTEMLQLDISGGGLPLGLKLRLSPDHPSTGQTWIEPIPGGYKIKSYFDLWIDLSTDGGSWETGSEPKHMVLKLDPHSYAAVAAPTPFLPMPNGQYVGRWQAYANGIMITNILHKLFTDWIEPPLFGYTNTHTFGSQLDFQLSTDGGLTFTAARAPATMTVSINNVRGFQGRSTYETEVTQLRVSGGDLPAGVQIRGSTTQVSKGGTSALTGGGGVGAGGGAAISSFFDIFTEVSTDGGSSWNPATNGPCHMELQRIAEVHPFPNNLLPSPLGEYVSHYHGNYANNYNVANSFHSQFTSPFSPPPEGSTNSHTFGSQVEFDLSQDGGQTFTLVTAPSTVTVQITCRLDGDGTTEYYDTEMTQLDISGGNLPPGVQIRESPTKASLGRTTSSAVGGGGGGGGYQIDSFFDVFTEVSTDGGQSWLPTIAGPATVTLLPGITITPVPLNIQLSGTNVVLSWPDTGWTLTAARVVTGPYTNVSGATSPYTLTPSNAATFYRLKY